MAVEVDEMRSSSGLAELGDGPAEPAEQAQAQSRRCSDAPFIRWDDLDDARPAAPVIDKIHVALDGATGGEEEGRDVSWIR